MDYVEVEEAIGMPGLRLVLSAGVPGPWGEAAKSIFDVKGIEWVAVRQTPGRADPELLEWTGQSGAPVAIYEDERPRSGWAEILLLAERLRAEPPLVPDDAFERATMLGLCHEICGEQGLGWSRRLQLLPPPAAGAGEPGSMPWKYGVGETAIRERANERIAAILDMLAARLHAQRALGHAYFMGPALSALDIHWAAFSNLIAPLPPERSPMPEFLRPLYDYARTEGAAAVDPILIDHRDRVFEEHLRLPQDF